MQIHLDNTHSVGLGDHLCLISMLCDMKQPVEVLSSNAWNTYTRLESYKRVLNIPDSLFKLTLVETNGTFPVTGWPLKLFSPYYKAETVNINGNELAVNDPKNKKHCIGLVCYTTNHMFTDADNNYIEWVDNVKVSKGVNDTFPDCKLRPINYYAKLFEYIKTNRYDVMTIDSMDTDFDDKVEMMVRHCKAIVGYEGGIAHLSHMLDIPFFMLNWKLPSPSTNLNDWHCELVHRAKNVHFFKDDEEIFSWDAVEFDHRIHMVKHNYGNNRTMNGDYWLDMPQVNSPINIKEISTLETALSVPGIIQGQVADLFKDSKLTLKNT